MPDTITQAPAEATRAYTEVKVRKDEKTGLVSAQAIPGRAPVDLAPGPPAGPRVRRKSLTDLANPDTDQDTKVNATPDAVKKAEELGVDITAVTGSGAEGRILVADVVKAHEAETEDDQDTE